MATMAPPPLQTGPRPPYRTPLADRYVLSGIAVVVACGALLTAQVLTFGGTAYSFSSAHTMCASGFGQLAQALSPQAAANCTVVNDGWLALWLGIIAGAGLILRGLYVHNFSGRTRR
jgi:hypothetical protein